MTKHRKSDRTSIVGLPVVIQIFKDYPGSDEKHAPIEGTIKKEVRVNGVLAYIIESSDPEVNPPIFMVTEVARGNLSILDLLFQGSEEIFVAIAPVSNELLQKKTIDDYENKNERLVYGIMRCL